MTERLWTTAQFPKLNELRLKYQIPDEMINEMENAVRILDTTYGENRKVDEDDGGYILFILPDMNMDWRIPYTKMLKQYQLKIGEAEFQDTFYVDKYTEWHMELFLISNDYGVIVVYLERKGGK